MRKAHTCFTAAATRLVMLLHRRLSETVRAVMLSASEVERFGVPMAGEVLVGW